MSVRTMRIIRADARNLPIADNSVDLICTSPPYWSLRSYQDGGEHYDGQIGAESTPSEYIDALLDVTRECVRVLKPTGSIWFNLGDKYSTGNSGQSGLAQLGEHYRGGGHSDTRAKRRSDRTAGFPQKSLLGLPWRYALRCIDELGLILRAEVIWSKPNGLPESVRDRVRRSHEQWFHFTLQPRYYSAIDEIREQYGERHGGGRSLAAMAAATEGTQSGLSGHTPNPLGKLPGSVWTVATEPLRLPADIDVDHFACLDETTEILTRRGWLTHDQLRDDDEVAGNDLDTGTTRWTRLHGIHRYDYDGELVAVEARGLSMRLTPNHRTLVHRHAGRHRLRQPVGVVRADQVTSSHSIPRAVTWVDDGREKSLGRDLAALLGWVAAEGWYNPNRAVYLSQSLTKNARKVAQIDALLDHLGGAYRTERERTWRGTPWTDVTWRLNPDLAADVRRLMPAKILPALDLPLDEAQAMLDAFVAGDGHVRPDGRRAVFQKDRANLDVLQSAAVRLGFNTTLRESGGRWVLYLNPPRPARLRRADGTSLVGRENYSGTVWCVTTGTGTFVVRRNGTVFVTGNSFPTEWPFRIVRGWSPREVCSACGEGRRPVSGPVGWARGKDDPVRDTPSRFRSPLGQQNGNKEGKLVAITGYVCACPDTTAPTTPGLVLDPFGGTGTTAHVAHALGRTAVTVDASADYCRIAAHPEVLAKRAAKVAKKLAARRQVADSPQQDALPIELEEGPAA